jgi:adenine-specific DNA methylase
MKSSAQLRDMRRIAEIRELQRKRAEADAFEATSRTATAEGNRNKVRDMLDEKIQCWNMSVSGSNFDLGATQFWADAIGTGSIDLAETENKLNDSRDADKRARNEWARALGYAEQSRSAERSAQKGYNNRLSELRLTEMADQFTHRAAVS